MGLFVPAGAGAGAAGRLAATGGAALAGRPADEADDDAFAAAAAAVYCVLSKCREGGGT